MTVRELQDILNLLPTEAKDVTVISTRNCKISATVPGGKAWADVNPVWSLVSQARATQEPGYVRVIYTGPRSEK